MKQIGERSRTARKMGVTLVVSLVLFHCYTRAAHHATAGYELTGTITYKGTLSNQFTKAFWVSFDSCRWSIITSNKLSGPDAGHCKANFDGTNIYKVDHFGNRIRTTAYRFENGKITNREMPGPVQSRNKATLTISSNSMPAFSGDLIAPLWLAFVSQCVLDSQGSNGLVAPVWATGNTPRNHHAEWLKGDREPHFPVRVVYRNQGVVRVFDPELNRETEVALPAPYQNGYTQAVFEVRGFRTAGDFEYPISARLTQFGRKTNAVSSGDVTVISVVDIVCETFQSLGELAAQSVPKNVLVVDERLKIDSKERKSTAFAYLSSNGVIVPPEVVRTNPEYIKRQSVVSPQSMPKTALNSTALRFLFLSILLASLVGLAVATYAWKRRT